MTTKLSGKILVPMDGDSMDSTVCPSFGRAPYFLIYDTSTKHAEFLKNAAADSAGGAGIAAAQGVVDLKVTALLTPRLGKNAGEVIMAGGVLIYETKGPSIKENLDAYEAGALEILTRMHEGFHGHA